MATSIRIVFMGTPEFAVPSLDILVKNNYNVVGVITAPDKPSGRGLKFRFSPVKIYAMEHDLKILQPENLKDETFIKELSALNPDLQVVVAFRILPEVVWAMPRLGTFNLHASLLPQYRGAAPINWAIINGEKETGLTSFFLRQEVDTGNIIFHEKIFIKDDETAGELHDRLTILGADLVLKTVRAIETGEAPRINQESLRDSELKRAPKILKEHCKINWNEQGIKIYNLIRGLSPTPTADTELVSPAGKSFYLKIYGSFFEPGPSPNFPIIPLPDAETEKRDKERVGEGLPSIGSIITDSKSFLKIAVKDGYIYLTELQLANRKRMKIEPFLRGFKINNEWRAR